MPALTLTLGTASLVIGVALGATPSMSRDTTPCGSEAMFYINPEDPSLIVPKRAGIGTTINLGHPVGRAIGALIILILAGAAVTTAISCA